MNAKGTQYGTVRGLRSLTPQSAASGLAARAFDGLPPGVTRSDVMRALQAGGPRCGLTGVQVKRLVYLVQYTAEIDWQGKDAKPVVWVSVGRMADELGVSRQRIAAVERQLAEAGWVSHRDAADRRRRGERDPETGRIVNLRTFGIELGALGARYGELEAAARRHGGDWPARRDARRSSSALRGEIRRLHAALEDEVMPGEAPPAGLPAGAPLEDLEDENAELRALRARLADRLAALAPSRPVVDESPCEAAGGETQRLPSGNGNTPSILIHTESREPKGNRHPRSADRADPADEVPTDDPPCPTGDNASGGKQIDPNVDFGVQHVSPARVAAAASGRWRELSGDDPGRRDNMWAADVLRLEHGIHDKAWNLAVRVLGVPATVVLVAIIDGRCQDRATLVRNPSGFVVGCVKRAEAGGLHLHRSIWGLERQRRWREAWWPYAGEGAGAGAAP